LKNRKLNKEGYPFYYLDYLIGVAKLNQLDLSAKQDFIKYTTNFKGKNYIKSSFMYLSWIALLENDTSQFIYFQNKINNNGDTFVDSDREAQKQFNTQSVPNVFLMKARLLFDGGKYDKSIAILESSFFQNSSDNQLEKIYRLSRNFEKTNNIEKAKEYYLDTYKIGKNKPFYYAANSALNLALLFEKEKNNKKAKEYFLKCIDLENHQYEQGIEQKAKAGLNRLNF